MIEIIVYTLLGIVVLINVLLLLFWFRSFKTFPQQPDLSKKVSVLVAARNEENRIGECLEALQRQNYPKHNLEILVGNDQSTDNTGEIVKQFEGVRLIDIHKDLGKAKGKANVLAHLAHEAKGEVFMITDADVRPNENWIKNMTSYLAPGVGIVNGTTAIKNNLFQHYEWLFAQGMLKILSDIFRPATAIGNNMLVTREAYESTGGYENIPFSVTEDFALYDEVSKKGFKLRQVMDKGVLAWTFPPGGLKNLLHQRKRWMQGAIKLPLPMVSILFFQGLFFTAFVIAMFFDPGIALTFFVVKVFLQSIFIKSVCDKLGIRMKGGLILYELYTGITSTLTMLFFAIPVKLSWKDRTY